MLKPRSNFTVSILFGGALSLWACTSGQSLRDGKPLGTGGGVAGSGGGMAGSGGSSPTGGTGGDGGKGGSGGVGGGGGTIGHGSTGAGGTKGTGGNTERDAAIEVGPPDAPSSEAMPDRGVTESSTVVMDSAGMDSAGVDSDGVLRGYIVNGSELMAFELCGTSELIWLDVSGNEKGIDRLDSIPPYLVVCPRDGGSGTCVHRFYTELVGVISPPGIYGQLGKFSRELRVQEFLVVSLADSPTCPFLPPVFPN